MAIKIGDYVTTPEFDYEVRVTGFDRGTGELIVEFFLDNGDAAYKTVPRKTAKPFVDKLHNA